LEMGSFRLFSRAAPNCHSPYLSFWIIGMSHGCPVSQFLWIVVMFYKAAKNSEWVNIKHYSQREYRVRFLPASVTIFSSTDQCTPCFMCAFFFWVLGFEHRASHLLGRPSATTATLLALLCFSYFSGRVLCFWPGPASDKAPPTYCLPSCLWDHRCDYTWFIDWDAISLTFVWAGLEPWSFRSLPPE
jgi:hypothetical protein